MILGGTEFFHHHDSTYSGKDNSHCQACLLGYILHSTVTSISEIKFIIPEYEISIFRTTCELTELNSHKSLSDRAPPVF
jgi:hypothetical protein